MLVWQNINNYDNIYEFIYYQICKYPIDEASVSIQRIATSEFIAIFCTFKGILTRTFPSNLVTRGWIRFIKTKAPYTPKNTKT